MEPLVPLKVAIGLNANGRHQFPAFNSLPGEVRGNTDWSHFIDRYGGWHYDSVTGHNEDNPELGSPQGVWLGMLLVPEPFADAALAAFPETVTEMSPDVARDFYEQRVTVNQPEIRDDAEALAAIKSRRDAGIPDDADVANALDPDHPQPGRRRNKTKTFEGLKAQRGIVLKTGRTRLP